MSKECCSTQSPNAHTPQCMPPRFKETKRLSSEEALDLICGPRMEFYGPPKENLQDIADTWTPYVKRALALRGALNATDVCTLMIMLKCVRQARGYHRDSTVDISGYSVLAEVLNEEDSFEAFVMKAADRVEGWTAQQAFINRFLPGRFDKEASDGE